MKNKFLYHWIDNFVDGRLDTNVHHATGKSKRGHGFFHVSCLGPNVGDHVCETIASDRVL